MVPNPALLEILTRVNSRESFSRGYSFSRYPVQVQIRNNIAGLSVGAAPSVDVSDLRHVGIHMGKDNFLEISTKKEGGLYLLGFYLRNSEIQSPDSIVGVGGSVVIDLEKQVFYEEIEKRIFIPLDSPMKGSLLMLREWG